MDVVFLAYANSKEHPLPALIEEEEQVYSALVNKALGGNFFIHRERYATPEKVNEYLGKFGDRLAVFLYSGHAGNSAVLLDDKEANAAGIALQLKQSVSNGVLKLVVLNGCSTAGQVKALLEMGVPAVVATSAPIEDSSAKAFAVRFFQVMSESRKTIADAFSEALGPAQLLTKQDLTGKHSRDIGFAKTLDAAAPLWELFYALDGAVDINPLPLKTYGSSLDYDPNEILVPSLYESLYNHGSPHIKYLKDQEMMRPIPEEEKFPAILANFPFPVATHLQKLLIPIEDETLGCDKANVERLEQVGRLYQSTTELMAVIMVAQVWELKLRNKELVITADLKQALQQYFYLSAAERAVCDYLPFIKTIRQFIDTLPDVDYFIKELKDLKEASVPGHPFEKACRDLFSLRQQTVKKAIPDAEVEAICYESEKALCAFFDAAGFFFRYTLTSIQSIDTLKYRHEASVQYKHRIFQLMQGGKSKELVYYLLPNYLDSMGILVTKRDIQWVGKKNVFTTGQPFEYLNLSPFLIDRTAFEGGDVSNLMFFSQYYPQSEAYEFKNVSKPDSKKDALKIEKQEAFEAVRQQLEAFRVMILGESPAD